MKKFKELKPKFVLLIHPKEIFRLLEEARASKKLVAQVQLGCYIVPIIDDTALYADSTLKDGYAFLTTIKEFYVAYSIIEREIIYLRGGENIRKYGAFKAVKP